MLPRYPSACGVCLELGRPQLFRVSKRFFEILGVVAPLVTDGLLLPWQVDGTRGTIFIMAHERDQAFDADDLRMMQMLADFAAMGFRHQRQQKKLIEQESALLPLLPWPINSPTKSTIPCKALPTLCILPPRGRPVQTRRRWATRWPRMWKGCQAWSINFWFFPSAGARSKPLLQVHPGHGPPKGPIMEAVIPPYI